MLPLRSTKHFIRLLSRTNRCQELPLFYIEVRRFAISAPSINLSQVSLKRTGILSNIVSIHRYYGSDVKLPAHKTVALPALSPTMERGNIVSWEKKEGDRLNEGDLLAEIETDKATMGFETPEEGYLAKILIPGGTKEVPIGKIVCVIVESEDDVAAFKDYVPSGESLISKAPTPPSSQESQPSQKPKEKSAPPRTSSMQAPVATPAAISPGGRVFASPYAKKLAKEKGIDILTIGQGTGPEGRIRVEDVENFKGIKIDTSPSATASFTNVPITAAKQENYQQLSEWKKKVPQYYLTVEVQMDNIIKFRNELNSLLPKEADKITEIDFIIKASALACQAVPEANSSWQNTHIRRYNTVNINVVLNSDEAVYAPVLAGVERKGLASISKELSQLKTKVSQGTLQSPELQGGTFTINNLAMYKVKHFSQIINYPQACSLSIGSIRQQFMPNENSESGRAVANVMCATLSCDHRVVDGAVGAQWLGAFKSYLEKPQLMLM